MSTGWARVYRQLTEGDFWLSEKFTKPQAWVDLIVMANHKEGSFWVRGIEVKLDRGEIGWSELTMARRWKWSRNKIRLFLNYLSTNDMIDRKKVQQITTIIKIKNYEKYQSMVQQEVQQEVQQKDNRRYTNNNVKNDKNVRILTTVNRTSPFGSEEINLVIGEFSKRLGRIPADKYPRKVAQNSRQVINGFIKRQGEVFSKVRGTELTFSYVLEKSWDWYMSKDYALKTEKLESYHSRLRVFIADKEKQLETEGRRS